MHAEDDGDSVIWSGFSALTDINTSNNGVPDYDVSAYDATGRLRATTTKLAEHLFPTLAELGIDAGRIRLQPIEKAKREGAGSGYFAPVGHPHQPAYASLSIECVMADGSELEVAEISAEPDGPHSVRGAIGLDRVVMARSDRPITWSERLPVFKDAVEQDARRRSVPLPVGYYEMLGLPPPGASKAG